MIAVISIAVKLPSIKSNANAPSVAEIVMEKTSGRILHEINANQKLPIASTTKTVTAITVIENYDLEQTVTVPKECVGVEGSSIYLKEGEKYSVKDLLFGLMLRSGNDCAETLAITLSGSISNFTDKMNDLATKCGAKNTNFVNPHGLHDDNHYSSAYDLAKITCHALKNEKFKEIVSAKRHVATELTTNTKREWINKNKMLSSYEGATGVKTGFTKKAGRCLISSAQDGGMEIVCVVLNSPMMFERSKQLLDCSFQDYKLVKVIDKDKFNYVIPNENGEYKCLKIDFSFYYPIKNGEVLTPKLILPEKLETTVKSNQIVGKIEIYGSKQLIFYQNIYTL